MRRYNLYLDSGTMEAVDLMAQDLDITRSQIFQHYAEVIAAKYLSIAKGIAKILPKKKSTWDDFIGSVHVKNYENVSFARRSDMDYLQD